VITPSVGKSIAARLIAWFVLMSVVVVVAIGFYLHGALAKAMTARHEMLLTTMATLVRNMVEDIPSADRLLEHPDIIGHVLGGHPYVKLWIGYG
jgi:hypothetical protein